MNNELQQALTNLIKKSAGLVEQASQHTPEVIQDLLFWNAWASFWMTLAAIGAAVVLIVIAQMSINKVPWSEGKKEDDEGEEYIFLAAGLWLSAIITLIKITDFTFIQIWLAPNSWLLEYATNMVK